MAALLRRHPGLLVALLRQLEDVRGEVLERALQVALELADGVGRGRARTGLAAEPRLVEAPRRRAAPASRAASPPTTAGPTGSIASASCTNTREPARARREHQPLDRQPGGVHFLEQRRRRHDRVVLERERRQRHPPPRQAQQILEPRARRGEAILLARPAELPEQRLRIEDAARAALRPVRLATRPTMRISSTSA